MERLWDALVAEGRAFDAIRERLNQGVLPEDPKVPVLKLIGAYGKAVEKRKAIELRDAILERVPS
jgi:hypothetical protein